MTAYDASRRSLLNAGDARDFFQDWTSEPEAALCAEMARLAYCREAEVVEDALARVGFTLSLTVSEGGTSGFVATSDETALVAFRGTESAEPANIVDDGLFLPRAWTTGGRVHWGFARAFERAVAAVETTMRDSSRRLLVTGHSLGAALASLAASIHPHATLYTYGSPRVGDGEFARSLAARTTVHRHVNCCDLVCGVPLWPYVHVGEPVYIDRSSQVRESPTKAEVLRDRAAARIAYLKDHAWKPTNLAIRDLADHSPINYVRALRRAR